jgi:dTDP-4-amino-4,6-dideoxygalactose transaminase
MTRAEVMAVLKDKGVGTQVHYIPVHTQPYYRKAYGTRLGDLPIAEKYYDHCLSLPLFPAMTENDVERVISAVVDLA